MSLIYGRLTMSLCIIQQPVSIYDSPFYHIALWSGGWGISPMPATAPRISNYLLEKCRIVHQQPEDCWIWWPTSQILGMGLALHFWCYPVQLPGDVLGLQRLYDYRILYDYRLYVICRSIMYPTNSNFEHGHWLTTAAGCRRSGTTISSTNSALHFPRRQEDTLPDESTWWNQCDKIAWSGIAKMSMLFNVIWVHRLWMIVNDCGWLWFGSAQFCFLTLSILLLSWHFITCHDNSWQLMTFQTWMRIILPKSRMSSAARVRWPKIFNCNLPRTLSTARCQTGLATLGRSGCRAGVMVVHAARSSSGIQYLI